MGLFNNFLNSTPYQKYLAFGEPSNSNINPNTIETDVEEDAESKDKWVWIDGYKATDPDGLCMNNFKYEVGKTYSMDANEIEICKSGFHFCPDPRNLHYYYPVAKVFKVRGLVKVKEDEDCLYNDVNNLKKLDKLVAKKIEILEEIPYDTFKKWFPEIPWVDSEEVYYGELWEFYKKHESFTTFYWTWVKKKAHEKLIENGMSEIFAEVVLDDVRTNNSFSFEKLVKYYIGLKNENLSKDMIVYLLMKKIEKINSESKIHGIYT